MSKQRSFGAMVAEQHRGEGAEEARNTLVTEIFEALADWDSHKAGCHCDAFEVLKVAFEEWERRSAEDGGGLVGNEPVHLHRI